MPVVSLLNGSEMPWKKRRQNEWIEREVARNRGVPELVSRELEDASTRPHRRRQC